MSKIRFQQQNEHSECGLACVAMIIDFFKKRVKLAELRELYGVPTGGYNFFQMKQILEEFGVHSKAVKTKFSDLVLLPPPFIVFWNKKHFVVVEKITSKVVKVVDPALGKQKMTPSDFKKNYSEYALYVVDDKQDSIFFQPIQFNSEILHALKNNKKSLVTIIFISLMMQTFNILLPTLIQRIIDGNLDITSNIIQNFFVFFILLLILYFLTNMAKIRIITNLQTSFDKDLLSLTIRYLLDLPYSYFTNRSKGELIYRINSNTYIRQILIDNVIGSATDLLFFIIYLVALFYVNSLLASITLAIAVIILIFSIISAKMNQIMTQKELVTSTKSQEITSELVNNIFTIKATNSQKRIYHNWITNFEEQINLEKKKSKYSSILLNIPQTIQAFYSLIIIFIGYLLVTSNKMTIGEIVAFNAVGVAFLTPMMSMIGVYSQLLIVKVYIEKLLDILDSPSESTLFGDKNVKRITGQVELENIFYRYSKFSDFTLSNISLKIAPKEKIAIVGPSGSGKSTLLQVIAGFYKCTYGYLKYDDTDISNIDIKTLRKHLGIVLQNHNVFNGTIRENILMGRHFSDEEIWDVLKKIKLDDFVAKLPIGLDTYISESGNNISGGQSQKLSLARTIISKPSILLLDEPTSALDNISELTIMENLFNTDATIVVVAHRLSTIENFDKIFVMDSGKIIGEGTHQQLIESNSLYQTLYRKSTKQ